MKNLGPRALTFGTFAVAFGVFLFAQHPVQAQAPDEALVIHGCPENLPVHFHSVDGKGNKYEYDVCADIVFTPSGNVNATLHGSLTDPSTAPAHAVVIRDFPCYYPNGSGGVLVADDSQLVITPDGSVEGNCQLHKQ